MNTDLGRPCNVQLAHLTQGISPASLISAYVDWLVHLMKSPGKQANLIDEARCNVLRMNQQAAHDLGWQLTCSVDPLPEDHRFDAQAWQQRPFNLIYQSFLMNQLWWQHAATDVQGVSAHHEHLVTFFTRQWLDIWSPSNFIGSNPEVLAETVKTGGNNLLKGMINRIDDALQIATGEKGAAMQSFRPGHEVAITPGKIVFSNELIELIRYGAQTDTVFADPVMIVPSWIMKFYILDLSPHNSLVRFLVERGHTVFMVSWKNPDSSDSQLGLDNYLNQGIMAAVDAITRIMPKNKIQAVGYCLGGTLLAIAAATLARSDDERLSTLTLLASETDFSEPGELGLFIDESQLAYLDDVMSEKGYLDGKQMAGAFALLDARDLVWSRMEHEYLMGRTRPISDLLAWNADATRMPLRQHHEYLHRLYLKNDLAEGHFTVGGKPVILADLRLPMFVLATEKDTVSPWQSVYKIHLLTRTNLTFCLTTGGHNVGIVNPPGPGVTRGFRLGEHDDGDRYIDPATWFDSTVSQEGSWWPAWQAWLANHSAKRIKSTPTVLDVFGKPPLVDAPGRFVLSA